MTERHQAGCRRGRALTARLLCIALLACLPARDSCASGAADNRRPALPGGSPRAYLSAELLLGEDELSSPVPTLAYTPTADARAASARFEGVLEIEGQPQPGRLEALVDVYDVLADERLQIARLPPFAFAFVQHGDQVIPVSRGPQASPHPYWEVILEPGRAWNEPHDRDFTRVALPFSLQERNQNCTHNGLLTFLFRPDGAISRLAYQIGSETCRYFQANLWGVTAAVYRPGPIARRAGVVSAYRDEVAGRLRVAPVSALPDRYPQIDLARFRPRYPEHVTVYGFVIDGTHYVGGCDTRFGPYPFCEVLDLPSYSLAKAIATGLAAMYLERRYPGFVETPVSDLVPACRDARWAGVRVKHLLDMSTGLYDSPVYEQDESAPGVAEFFIAETHADKIRYSCNAYLRQAPPGEVFAYHTSDTYIAGTAINSFLRNKAGARADFYSDILVKQFWKPLGLSPVTHTTRRTYDDVAQPFSGYGLTLHSDDIARIAVFLNSDNGYVAGRALLDVALFDAAMQRGDHQRPNLADARGQAFVNGFWGIDVAPWIGCSRATWVPFLSGYGGISVALLPNDTVYYVFGDGDVYQWANATAGSHEIRPLCEAQ